MSDSKKHFPAKPPPYLRFFNLGWVGPILLFLALALVFHFSSPNIPDPDSFYHIKHAQIYRTEGLPFSSFPWTQYSAIKSNASDIWYGFHVLLIPFSALDGAFGIKLAGVVLTFFTLAGLWFVFKRHHTKWPALWPVLIFISAPNIMNRLLMMRPHLLSLALTVLLFSFLILPFKFARIPNLRSYVRYMPIFILVFLVSWVHLSLVWVIFLVFGIVFLIKLLAEKIWFWREGFILVLGSLVGWLARPNPIGSLKLVYIQVVQLMLEKQQDFSLLFGRELFPLAPQTLFQNFSAFMLLWFLAAGILIWQRRSFRSQTAEFKVLVYSSLTLSLFFFVLTITAARRAHDFWIPFGTVFMAVVFTGLMAQAKLRPIIVGVTALVSFFLLIYTPWRNSVSLEERAIPPGKFKEAALWLKENSQPGGVVFNLRWSDFPMLFFWNDKNYYIGGMDPIFQYSYDQKLYWKFHYLSADQVTKYTCPAPACTKDMLEDTYTVLKNDFKAKYVFLEKQRNPLVYYYLESTPEHYTKKIDTVSEAVYEIK